jgi:hypothetical protein
MSKFYPTFNDLKTPDNTERTVKKVYDFLYNLTDQVETTNKDMASGRAADTASATAAISSATATIQLETSVAAAATDPATTMALVNELRAALIAAKICK